MNREIFKSKIAEVISSTNKSGNEKLEAILAAVGSLPSDNTIKEMVSFVRDQSMTVSEDYLLGYRHGLEKMKSLVLSGQ